MAQKITLGLLGLAVMSLATVAPSMNSADAANLTEYDQCMFNGQQYCFIVWDGNYPVRPIDWGNPEEAAAAEACYAAWIPNCSGLPGDPSNP